MRFSGSLALKNKGLSLGGRIVMAAHKKFAERNIPVSARIF